MRNGLIVMLASVVGAASAATQAGVTEPEAIDQRLQAVLSERVMQPYLAGSAPVMAADGDVLLNYPGSGGGSTRSGGPDVIVGDLHDLAWYGTSNGITAFAVGTVSCNVGNVWLNWIASTNQHPVIGQNMYRYKVVDGAGRFEQIGQSWLKHGFFALSGSLCFNDCQPTDGTHLGVHCSDPYSAGLNGSQSGLGPRSQVNPSTGFYPYPFTAPPAPATIGRRLQVQNADLDPAQNAGATYFVEGQYVAADDAAAGNGNNNASWRRVSVAPSGPAYSLAFVAGHGTHREEVAMNAWQDLDPEVVIRPADVPGDGRFWVGHRVTDLGNGRWRYEYAVHNLNSDRAARSFYVPAPECATLSNIGFHDVASHSGEPFSLTDWTASENAAGISWATEPFATNPDANALRWGAMYNFRFDADVPPVEGTVRIGMFKPGSQPTVGTAALVPGTACETCDADLDGSGGLTLNDFVIFRSLYLAGDLRADFDGNGSLTLADFSAFRDAYVAGCP